MKKITILLLFILFSLLGCANQSSQPQRLTVLVPNGMTAIAQSNIEYHQQDLYDIERVSGPQTLISSFTSESHDIIIAPINLGANLYQKNSNYQLAGVLTWTNFQILSKTPITSIEDFSNQTLIGFGQGSTPEIMIRYLFNAYHLSTPAELDFSAISVQDALTRFMQNQYDFAIVSEPVSTQALSMNNELYVYDLASDWMMYTEQEIMPQAGVFVHKDLSLSQVNAYLNHLDEASKLANSNPSLIAGLCESLEYPFSKNIIEASIPNGSILFQDHQDADISIQSFLQLIYDFNPALIGDALPDQGFYYPLS